MTIFLIVVAYTVLTTALGIIVGRRNQSLNEFFVAQDKLGLGLACMMLMAGTFAGAFTAGTVSEAYKTGFAPFIPVIAMAVGYLLFIPLIPFYRSMAREGHISIPEAFSVRFDGKVQAAILIVNSLAYGALFAVQPVAFASIVAPMLGVSIELVTWCTAVVMAIMALTGLTGVAWMNTVNCLIMVGGISAVSVAAIGKAGGLSQLAAVLPTETWNIFQPNVPSAIIRLITLSVCMLAASEGATIAIGAKTGKTAKHTMVIVSAVIVIFTCLLVMTGISGRILTPGLEQPSTALYSIAAACGPVFSIVASIAIIAAILDAPAYLIYCTTGITQNVFAATMPGASEKRLKLYSTIFIVALSIGGTFMALHADSILNFLFSVFEIQSIGGLVLLIAMYWKRVSAKAAFWAIIIGGGCSAIWMILGNPFGLTPSWVVLILGLTTLTGLTLAEKERVYPGYTEMRRIMELHPD